MLSHISVLPLLLEWMQGSRSVGRVIRLAADYEGSGRRSRTCRQRKPNVLVVEDERVGRGSRTFWLWKTIVLAGEGKRSGRVGASALAEEDKCACRGRQARLLWITSVLWQRKTSAFAEEDEWAGCGRSRGFRRT